MNEHWWCLLCDYFVVWSKVEHSLGELCLNVCKPITSYLPKILLVWSLLYRGLHTVLLAVLGCCLFWQGSPGLHAGWWGKTNGRGGGEEQEMGRVQWFTTLIKYFLFFTHKPVNLVSFMYFPLCWFQWYAKPVSKCFRRMLWYLTILCYWNICKCLTEHSFKESLYSVQILLHSSLFLHKTVSLQ